MFLALAIGSYKAYLTKDVVAIVITLCAMLASIVGNLMPKRLKKVFYTLSSGFWTVVAIGIFVGIGITS